MALAASTVTWSLVASRCSMPRSKYLMSRSRYGRISCNPTTRTLPEPVRHAWCKAASRCCASCAAHLILDLCPDHPVAHQTCFTKLAFRVAQTQCNMSRSCCNKLTASARRRQGHILGLQPLSCVRMPYACLRKHGRRQQADGSTPRFACLTVPALPRNGLQKASAAQHGCVFES